MREQFLADHLSAAKKADGRDASFLGWTIDLPNLTLRHDLEGQIPTDAADPHPLTGHGPIRAARTPQLTTKAHQPPWQAIRHDTGACPDHCLPAYHDRPTARIPKPENLLGEFINDRNDHDPDPPRARYREDRQQDRSDQKHQASVLLVLRGPDKDLQALQRLVARRSGIVRERTRLKNQVPSRAANFTSPMLA